MSRLVKRMIFVSVVVGACTAPEKSPVYPKPQLNVSSFVVAPVSLDWQQQARDLVAANNLTPLAAGRVYAALSDAEYRAVTALDDADNDGTIPAQGLGAGGRSALESHRGAVAGASAQVLTFFFPAGASSFEQRIQSEANAGPGNVHPDFTRGLAIGRGIGDAVVQRAQIDHFTAPFTGTIPTGTGLWIANGPPAGATLSGMTRYFLASADQFRPPPPPAFGSQDYLTALQEIRTMSDTRTADQRAIALQWNYGVGTFTAPGYWDLVTANYIQSYGLDERAAAHAFALTTTAMMDAFIGCWEAKYHYWFIRPPQADPLITVVFPLPNHPSYPSGHSCASAAAGTVLSYLFPDRADEVAGWVTQAGLSRMYAGIHYRFDIDAGRTLGENVGNLAVSMDRSGGLLATRTLAHDVVSNPNSAAGDAKGIIHGWLDGETVPLRYTRLYFCAQPPTSAVSTGCEVGAGPTITPRAGPIPKIYALAPVGFSPDPTTVHCPGGVVCLNHPHALDLSRVNGKDSVSAPAHSHIITDRQSGWHETVNIRVLSLDAWNDIAAAKTLTRVRELQAQGKVAADLPTNIYFFFEVQDPNNP